MTKSAGTIVPRNARSNHHGCRRIRLRCTTRVHPPIGSSRCQLQIQSIASPRWRHDNGRCRVDRSTSSRSASSRSTVNQQSAAGGPSGT